MRNRFVITLDSAGSPADTVLAEDAHRPPGMRHWAFSIVVCDPLGQVLLQQRASTKSLFADRWSNACCSHVSSGVRLEEQAARRLAAEMGFTTPLTRVGSFSYRAGDDVSGLVEYERTEVLVGISSQSCVGPNPEEVSDYRWVAGWDLETRMRTHPDSFSPWLRGVLETASLT
jgi:isopentenyl-diphosphate delta-isomerase